MRESKHTFFILFVTLSTATAATAEGAGSPADSTKGLVASEEVSRLDSMTIEAENRVQIRFARPAIDVDIDPASAPGLQWGSILDVLEREKPDLMQPLLATSVGEVGPHVARPWFRAFRSGPVARFRPAVDGVKSWSLTIADSRGAVVRTFADSGKPPKEIAWDGRTDSGELAAVGPTYSYVLEATDRAGNTRNFVGDSFEVPAYRSERDQRPCFVFTSDEVGADARGSAHLREIASRVNRVEDLSTPIRVVVTSRSHAEAEGVAADIGAVLEEWIIDGARRVMVVTEVATDAPPRAGVTVTVGS